MIATAFGGIDSIGRNTAMAAHNAQVKLLAGAEVDRVVGVYGSLAGSRQLQS